MSKHEASRAAMSASMGLHESSRSHSSPRPPPPPRSSAASADSTAVALEKFYAAEEGDEADEECAGHLGEELGLGGAAVTKVTSSYVKRTASRSPHLSGAALPTLSAAGNAEGEANSLVEKSQNLEQSADRAYAPAASKFTTPLTKSLNTSAHPSSIKARPSASPMRGIKELQLVNDKYLALAGLPGTAGNAVILDCVMLSERTVRGAYWYVVVGAEDKRRGRRFFAIIHATDDDIYHEMLKGAPSHKSEKCGAGDSGFMKAIAYAQNWLSAEAGELIAARYPTSILSPHDNVLEGGDNYIHIGDHGLGTSGLAAPREPAAGERFGMPRGRAEEDAGDEEMRSERQSQQLSNIASQIESMKSTSEELEAQRLAAQEKTAEAAMMQARTQQLRAYQTSAEPNKKTYGFPLKAISSFKIYLLRDYGRAGDSLFGERLYGHKLYDRLVELAASSYESSEEFKGMRVQVTLEWVVALCQVEVTNARGKFGLSPTQMKRITEIDAMDDGALEHPVHGTKVDTSKRIDIPYDSWTVDTWLSRMRLLVDVWCRAYGQRHKRGLSDCLDCLRDRYQADPEVYTIVVVHKFFFEYVDKYLKRATQLIDQFDIHLREERGGSVLGHESATAEELRTYNTDETGDAPEFPAFPWNQEGERELTKFIDLVLKAAQRKLKIEGVAALTQQVQQSNSTTKPKTRASGTAANDAAQERTVHFEESGVTALFKPPQAVYDLAKQEAPRGANGLPFCWMCNFVNPLKTCDQRSDDRIHDKFMAGAKITDALKCISIQHGGIKPPNEFDVADTAQGRRAQAEKLYESVKRKLKAQKAGPRAVGGRASGGGTAEAADLEGLGRLMYVPVTPDGEPHALETELHDWLRAVNEGKVDRHWLTSVIQASGKEVFNFLTDEPELDRRLLLLHAIQVYAMDADLFDSEAGHYVRSFVTGHLLQAVLQHLERGFDESMGEAKALVDDIERFLSVMAEGLENVKIYGADGVDELKFELQRLSLLGPAHELRGRRAAGGRAHLSGVAFKKSPNVFDSSIGAHTFDVTIGNLTFKGVDHGAYLVQQSGVQRKNACVLVSAGEGVAAAKGVSPDLGGLLRSMQTQAEVVKAQLGSVDDLEWISQAELEVRENVHDLLHTDHDMMMEVFRDVVPDDDDPAHSFKDVTLLGFFAEHGRVSNVRTVIGEKVASLGPDGSFFVAQLYFEQHATVIQLDTARDENGDHVDLLAPGAIDAWLGEGGVRVEQTVAVGTPTLVAMRSSLEATVDLAAQSPCPACSNPEFRKSYRASGGSAAVVVGGALSHANAIAKAATSFAEAVMHKKGEAAVEVEPSSSKVDMRAAGLEGNSNDLEDGEYEDGKYLEDLEDRQPASSEGGSLFDPARLQPGGEVTLRRVSQPMLCTRPTSCGPPSHGASCEGPDAVVGLSRGRPYRSSDPSVANDLEDVEDDKDEDIQIGVNDTAKIGAEPNNSKVDVEVEGDEVVEPDELKPDEFSVLADAALDDVIKMAKALEAPEFWNLELNELEAADIVDERYGAEQIVSTDAERAAALTAVMAVVAAPDVYTPEWRELVTLAHGGLLFETKSLPRAVELFRRQWELVFGKILDPERIEYLRHRIPDHLIDNLLDVSEHGASLQYKGPRRRRLIKPIKELIENLGGFWEQVWKQTKKGQVLLFDQTHLSLLAEVTSSPMMAVEKADSYGKLTGEYRYVHNLSSMAGGWSVNDNAKKTDFPSVYLPTHKQLAENTLAQMVLYPGIRIVGLKHDVWDAYPKIDIAPNDVALMATNVNEERGELPNMQGLDERFEPLKQLGRGVVHQIGAAITCLVVYITGTFGFRGLPGIYSLAGSWPIGAFHTSFRPALPSINGMLPFTSYTLVDDGALTTVDIGIRANMSSACYLLGMFLVFGFTALNPKKFKVDGTWATRVPIWGLVYRLGDTFEFSISSVRVEKVRRVFADKCWDAGRGALTVKQVQRGVGCLRHAGQVNRAIHTVYVALHRMLRVEKRGQKLADPPGTEAEKELYWHMLHDSIEFTRIQLSDPNVWRTSVLSSFASVINLSQRLAIPGEKENVVTIGSDATPWLLAVFNYELKECGLIVWTKEVVESIADALKKTGVPDHMLDEVIISIKELSAVVAMHASWGCRTRGKVYVNLNDNYNAVRWVLKRIAHNPFAHHLLLILGRLEMAYGNDTVLIYINTLRNEIPDYATRWVESVEEAQALIGHFDAWLGRDLPGWLRIDIAATTLPYLVTPWDKRSLALVNEMNPVPRALAAAAGRELDEEAASKVDKLLEQQLGGVDEVEAHRAGTVVFFGDGVSLVAHEVHRYNPELDVLFGQGVKTEAGKYLAASRSLSHSFNLGGLERDDMAVIVVASGDFNSYCEVTASTATPQVLTWLHFSSWSEERAAALEPAALGYTTTVLKLNAYDFGEPSARCFKLIVHERIELSEELGPASELAERGRGRHAALDGLAPVHLLKPEDECWLHNHARAEDVFVPLESEVARERGDRLLLLGHVHEGISTYSVYHVKGDVSMLGAAAESNNYYFDTRAEVVDEYGENLITIGDEPGVLRRLTKFDLWGLTGNPLIELLEWTRLYQEDKTELVPEPTDAAVNELLTAEPPTGLAIAVAKLYGGRVGLYLDSHPRRLQPQAPMLNDLVDLGLAEGFVPADFDVKALMSGELWNSTDGAKAASSLNPLAPTYEPGAAAVVEADHEQAIPKANAGARRRRGGGIGGLGSLLTLCLLFAMGIAAEGAGSSSTPLSTLGSSVGLWPCLFLLMTATCTSAAGARTGRGAATSGFNARSDLPELFEDLPRGDRRGGPRGQRFYEGMRDEEQKPKAEARRKYRTSRAAPFTGETHEAIERESKRLAASALSKSTIKSYDTAWRQWSDFLYNQYGETQPFLTGENKRDDIQKAIAFVSYLSSLGRAHSTIKKKLCGIRYHHRRHGEADPFADAPALTYHLKGLKKLAGGSRGKMPATKDMLEHASEKLKTGSVMLSCLNAGLQLAFFILLRSSEYCVVPLARNGAFDRESTLLDGDVMLIREGKMLPWDEVPISDYPLVTEVMINIKKSKTDQNRVGASRSVERTGHKLCAVEAILNFLRLRMEHGIWSDDDLPFMRWGSDYTQHLRRESISKVLKHAARDMGQLMAEYASHSLRIGGATALLHSGASPEAVRRYGRWKSDTWQQYSWTTRGLLSGLSKLMASSEYTLEMSNQQFVAARRAAGRGRGEGADDEVQDNGSALQGAANWTSDPYADPMALEQDKPISHYQYLTGLEFYDADDDARFKVTGLTEEMLAVKLSVTGAVEVSRCYVLAYYYDLDSGKEYYTTAKEVAVWVEETQAAAAQVQEPAPASASAPPRDPPPRRGPQLRQRQRVDYYSN